MLLLKTPLSGLCCCNFGKLNQVSTVHTGHTSKVMQPVVQERRIAAKASHADPVSQVSSHRAISELPCSKQVNRGLSLPTLPTQYQPQCHISATMGSSGKLSRSRGTFGSEHRWYQPTQAADRAAALSHEALAAAAAEQELDHASWLLESSPGSRSKSASRCTFGSELRWWEKVNQSNSEQAALHTPDTAHKLSTEHNGEHIRQVRGHGLPRQGSSFGTEPRFWSSPSTGHPGKPQLSAATVALSAARGEFSNQEAVPSSLRAKPGQRSVSVDRGLRQTQPLVSSERAWWSPDLATSPDSALQRIQQKHAQIQSLAAVINQRPTSARTHTVKSTFGCEARWWEKSAVYRSDSPSSQPDQHQSPLSTGSPERSSGVQHMKDQVSTPDIVHDITSSIGLESRWWERLSPSTAAAKLPQLQDPAAAKAAHWRSQQRSASPDPSRSMSSSNRKENWWQNSQEIARISQASSPHKRTGSVIAAPITATTDAAVTRTSSPPVQSKAQQEQVERLHAHSWSRPAQLQPEPQAEQSVHASRRESIRQSADRNSPSGSPGSVRSGSVSPTGSMQLSRRFSRLSSCRSELQETLHRRCALMQYAFLFTKMHEQYM